MAMRSKEIKLLWGKSGGRCAFENCMEELSQGSVVLGEQAHVIARSELGPRGISDVKVDSRDTYKNLILLCGHHHTIIDKDPKTYSIAVLQEMKLRHERWIYDQLSRGARWSTKLAQVHYLNIPRLSIIFALSGYKLPADLDIDIEGDLHDLGGIPLIRIMHSFAQIINDLEPIAIEMTDVSSADDEYIGAVVSFDENFRTKNYGNYSGALSGNLDSDPYIYKKSKGAKWILPLDPKWITTSTAQSEFCSGSSRFAGLAMIKSIKNNEFICTPLVLGIRKSAWSL